MSIQNLPTLLVYQYISIACAGSATRMDQRECQCLCKVCVYIWWNGQNAWGIAWCTKAISGPLSPYKQSELQKIYFHFSQVGKGWFISLYTGRYMVNRMLVIKKCRRLYISWDHLNSSLLSMPVGSTFIIHHTPYVTCIGGIYRVGYFLCSGTTLPWMISVNKCWL